MKKKCEDSQEMLIRHDVKIATLETAMTKMANTAQNIYMAVFGCLMTFIANLIIFWIKTGT